MPRFARARARTCACTLSPTPTPATGRWRSRTGTAMVATGAMAAIALIAAITMLVATRAAAAAVAAAPVAAAPATPLVSDLDWSSSWSSSLLSLLRDPSASPWVATFEFDDTRTDIPLVTWAAPLVAIAFYLSSIVAIKAWIARCDKPFQLKQFVILYNAILSILSLALFTHLSHHLLTLIRATSFLDVFCNPHHLSAIGITGMLPFLYYCNYLLKYLEFADTILLCLRGKPTPFLHVYHHAVTLLLCFTQLRAQTCLQWVFIVLNLFVHVFLYAYYALHESGGRVWWKRYLTIGQIGQFVIDLGAALVGMVIRLAWEINPAWSYECHGNWIGALSGFAIVFSYLVLFIKLYRDTYQQQSSKFDKSKSSKLDKSNSFDDKQQQSPSSTEPSSTSSTLIHRRPHTLAMAASPVHASAALL